MKANSILAELKSLGNPGVAEMMQRNHGVRQPIYGVKIGDMKPIQKRIKKDYRLALDLYASGIYDAQYFAGLIADDAQMTPADLDAWVATACGGSLPDSTVAWVTAGSPHGWQMALKWIDATQTHVQRAGWSTLSCLVALKPDAELDLATLKQLLKRAEKTLPAAENALRFTLSYFIISLGSYVTSLTDACRESGLRLGKLPNSSRNNSCKIPYIPDYIDKVEKRGNLGKKRKTVKC